MDRKLELSQFLVTVEQAVYLNDRCSKNQAMKIHCKEYCRILTQP